MGWCGGGLGSRGVLVGDSVLSIFVCFGDGVGVARFRKCSLLMGEENSSEDEELMVIVLWEQIGFTLMRAVFLMGRDDVEVIVDFVIVKMVG